MHALTPARLLVLLALPVLVHAQTRYTITNLGTIGGSNTTPTAINASGTVVGYEFFGGRFLHQVGNRQRASVTTAPQSSNCSAVLRFAFVLDEFCLGLDHINID